MLLVLLALPVAAQTQLNIPKPVDGWEKQVNSAAANTLITLGPGKYHTRVSLRFLNPNIAVQGAGARMTEIIADAKMPALVDSTSRIVSFRDLVLNANHQATVALHALKPTYPDTRAIEGVMVTNALGDGAVIEACQMCEISGLSSWRNGRDGIVLAGCNGCDVHGISSQFNGGRGIVISGFKDDKDSFSGGLTLTAANSESNQGAQIEVAGTKTSVAILNPWVEGGGEGVDGIRVQSPQVSIIGGRISGKSRGGSAAAVRLVGDGKDTIVSGVQMVNEAGNFARVAK
ncbi:hypothetical protein [Candidatus Korobacter versatilis]|uniref:hypothetical protein n=1 Tax=Candidatus Korobacter versatilis TaxID=658062 RepID=UPI0005A41C4C|nr:hypothetical protein [Candidatus Koribacter versatilis]